MCGGQRKADLLARGALPPSTVDVIRVGRVDGPPQEQRMCGASSLERSFGGQQLGPAVEAAISPFQFEIGM